MRSSHPRNSGPRPRRPTHAPRNAVHAGARSHYRAAEGGLAEDNGGASSGHAGKEVRTQGKRGGAVSQVRRRPGPQSSLSQITTRAGGCRANCVLSHSLWHRPASLPPGSVCHSHRRHRPASLPPGSACSRGTSALDGPCPPFKDAASSKPPGAGFSPFTPLVSVPCEGTRPAILSPHLVRT